MHHTFCFCSFFVLLFGYKLHEKRDHVCLADNCVLTQGLDHAGAQAYVVGRWQKEEKQVEIERKREREEEWKRNPALPSGRPQRTYFNLQERRVTEWESQPLAGRARSRPPVPCLLRCVRTSQGISGTSHFPRMPVWSCECTWVITSQPTCFPQNNLTWLLNTGCCSLLSKWGDWPEKAEVTSRAFPISSPPWQMSVCCNRVPRLHGL